MPQSNSNYKPSRASKRGMLWASHGKRAGSVNIDLVFMAKLNRYLRPTHEMYPSVIEAFEAARRERRGQ